MARKASVLVVDDEQIVQKSCTKVLAGEGQEVACASDGGEGLTKVRRGAYDVILVDLKMPVLGGIDLLKAIHQEKPEVAVVIITGYPSVPTAIETMKLGAFDYLCKPFTPHELSTVVSEAFEAKQGSMLDRRYHQMEYLTKLTGDWLRLSQLEAGVLDLEPETVELPPIIEEAWQAVPDQEARDRIDFELNIGPDVKPVRGEGNLLHELFTNLFSNAVRFTSGPGQLTVKLTAEGNTTVVSVSDAGRGIPDEELPHLFEPFYRGARADARRAGGAGLGLAVVKKIVSVHGGTISASSVLGKGATFVVRLPAETAISTEPASTSTAAVLEVLPYPPVVPKVFEVRGVTTNQLDSFLVALCRGREVFALEQAADQLHLVRADEWRPGKHTLGPFRPVQPLKSLFSPPRENLGFLMEQSELPPVRERIVLGVKNCDLSSLEIHDYVCLKSDPVDPLYAEVREKTAVVACDCTACVDVCFCTAVDGQPYVKKGFDINLSPISTGCLVEAGTERGENLLQGVQEYLGPADDQAIEERDKKRAAMHARVEEQTAKNGLEPGLAIQRAIQDSYESEIWNKFAHDCVGCGACNFVCCTCHCFLLADGFYRTKTAARIKQWDACLYENFARVAGGANPRGHRAERLHNRFDKKFNFFRQLLGIYGCVGCGRCTEACPGNIDIRDVLKEVAAP